MSLDNADVMVIRAQLDSEGQPVEGLRVELCAPTGEVITGRWTDSQGTAELTIGIDQNAPPPPLEVRAVDRWGDVVWRSSDVVPAAEGEFELGGVVSEDLLSHHRAVPLTWPVYEDGLVPDYHFVEIGDAIDLVATSPADHAYLSRLAKCLPELLTERELTSMAVGVLDGSPPHIERFRRFVEPLSRTEQAPSTARDREVHSSTVAPVVSSAALTAVASPSSHVDIGSVSHRELHELAGDGFIPGDRVTPIRIAALLAGETATEAERFLAGVEQALEDVEPYRDVWLAARAVLTDAGSVARLRSALAHWGSQCGPDDNPLWPWQWKPAVGEAVERPPVVPGPAPRIPPLPPPHCDPRRYPGWAEELRARLLEYEFTKFTPPRVCPGSTVVIDGKGFVTHREVDVYGRDASGNIVRTGTKRIRDDAGRVVFPVAGGEVAVQVAERNWTETEIAVETPPDLVTGEPYLLLGDEKMVICGRFANLIRPTRPNPLTLYSGHARSHGLRVIGFTDGYVEPGEQFGVTWTADPNPTTTVRLTSIDESTGAEKTHGSWTGKSRGSAIITLTPKRTTLYRFVLEVSTPAPCGSKTTDEYTVLVGKKPSPKIDGIEITQAVQHYKSGSHLADRGDYGPDNSVPLVDGKRALVRVYVRSGQAADFDGGEVDLEGRLEVRRRLGTAFVEKKTFKPINNSGICTAHRSPTYATERGRLGHTMNFVVPADWVVGPIALLVEVWPSEPAYAAVRARDSLTIDTVGTRVMRIQPFVVSATIASTPPLASTPTREEYLAMQDFTRDIFPLTRIERGPWRSLSWRAPAWDNWHRLGLLSGVNRRWVLDGMPADILYAALVDHPAGGGMQGLASMVSGFKRTTFAHEVGHWFEFWHTNTGKETLPLSSGYPTFKPHPRGSTGEYGWGLSQAPTATHRSLKTPGTYRDIMSYRDLRWIAPGRYRDVLNHRYLHSPAMRLEGVSEMRQEMRVVTGVLRGGRVEHLRSLVGPAPADDFVQVDSGLTLVTHRGADIRSVPLRAARAGDDDEGTQYFLVGVDLDVDVIEIRDGDEVLGWLTQRGEPPIVDHVDLLLEGEDAHLSWSASGEDLIYAVQHSSDDGVTWMTLDEGLTEPAVAVQLANLPGGEACRFRVLALDGFDSARGDSESFAWPRLPPEAAILAPGDGASGIGSRGILLVGDGSSQEGSLHDDALEWRSDVDGLLGNGEEIFTQDLSLGSHVVTLRARDQEGKVAEASISIEVRSEEDPAEG